MTKTTFQDKYPVWTLEIQKDKIKQKSVEEIIAYFKELVEAHPIARYIAIFDHYEHTTELGGKINPDIKAMQNIIFCFGPEIPSTKVASVRPRTLGVCELEDSFVIEFMEAPSPKAHETMQEWTKALKC